MLRQSPERARSSRDSVPAHDGPEGCQASLARPLGARNVRSFDSLSLPLRLPRWQLEDVDADLVTAWPFGKLGHKLANVVHFGNGRVIENVGAIDHRRINDGKTDRKLSLIRGCWLPAAAAGEETGEPSQVENPILRSRVLGQPTSCLHVAMPKAMQGGEPGGHA